MGRRNSNQYKPSKSMYNENGLKRHMAVYRISKYLTVQPTILWEYCLRRIILEKRTYSQRSFGTSAETASTQFEILYRSHFPLANNYLTMNMYEVFTRQLSVTVVDK
jgi:hypothetical protein